MLPFLRLTPGLVAAILFLGACGSSSPSPTQPSRPEFLVMTFNIQHGINGANKYDLSSAVDAIARINPDLVGVQELTRNHTTYDCDDQPARIAEQLSVKTGRQWRFVYQQEWFTSTASA